MGCRISIVGYDGCCAGVLMSTADLFTYANAMAQKLDNAIEKLFEVQIVSNNAKEIVCSNGYMFNPDSDLSEVGTGDIVIFHAHSQPLVNNSDVNQTSIPWIAIATWVESAVSTIRCLITNWNGSTLLSTAEDIATTKLKINPAKSNNIICVPQTMNWMDACLSIVERQRSKPFAQKLAQSLLLDWRLKVYANYAVHPHADSNMSLSSRAEKWIQENISENFSVEDVANQLAVSTRTLIRRFQERFGLPPQTYIQQTRIERCKILLETTSLRFSQIVSRCGYSDESAFRRIFKKKYHVSPTQYRKNFTRGDSE